ncbi:VWA domain-containing protein, partial [Rhodopirellula sallentina]
MACWIFPQSFERDFQTNTLHFAWADDVNEEQLLTLATRVELSFDDAEQSGFEKGLLDEQLVEVDFEQSQNRDRIEDFSPSFGDDLSLESAELLAESDVDYLEEMRRIDVEDVVRAASGTDELREARGYDSISQIVSNSIDRELELGDTLVVWLLDASISLVPDRVNLGHRMAEYYQRVDSFNTHKNDYTRASTLFSAVAAYGQGLREIVPPQRYGAKACNAMLRIPVDSSGLENVMMAVQKVAYHYRVRERRRERILFVVLTDESGDDTLLVEPTVQLCRRARIAVHVIGPTAVFGAERGSQLWHTGGKAFYIPVKRGPESALPERP